jgi:1,4-alpha-glucan branching enzyme
MTTGNEKQKKERKKKEKKSAPTMSEHIGAIRHDYSLFTDYDVHLFKEGNLIRLFDKLGSHSVKHGTDAGVYFAVWAPNAKRVSVVGDFNDWDRDTHKLEGRWDDSGIWEGFIPGLSAGMKYKYFVESNHNGYAAEKGDPFAFHWEVAPQTASRIFELEYAWSDDAWMKKRKQINALDKPTSIYEVHLGSWRRKPEEGNRPLDYRETAHELAAYAVEMGFTHVEFLPVMEHPFYGSWGYQTVGYFAPTSRYGSPDDFMYLIDYLHQHDIGVILDWVPSHFPSDEHGLAYYDGTHLFEHADLRQGFHPDWKSYIFNFGRNEVRNFLLSSAVFWLEKYHIDGLRVDAVASMLYLDYSREEGEWIPNQYGGRENLDAIVFLRQLNETVYRDFPDVQTFAEESTAWPMVSRPLYIGGLGFGYKWNMGWMHDTLEYMSKESIHKKFHHGQLTFSIMYAFTENFVLPLSHDEVVYGKGSLLAKMPGDDWQKRANLRALFGHMFMHPGKKLLFMGGEFGQWREWAHESSLDWHLVNDPRHGGIKQWVSDLNRFYVSEPALHESDSLCDGFRWIDCNDTESSIVAYLRFDKAKLNCVLVICNFTPVPRSNYRVGVPRKGFWKEALNSDSHLYGGSGFGNIGGQETTPVASHGMFYSLSLTVPPLSMVAFKFQAHNAD